MADISDKLDREIDFNAMYELASQTGVRRSVVTRLKDRLGNQLRVRTYRELLDNYEGLMKESITEQVGRATFEGQSVNIHVSWNPAHFYDTIRQYSGLGDKAAEVLANHLEMQGIELPSTNLLDYISIRGDKETKQPNKYEKAVRKMPISKFYDDISVRTRRVLERLNVLRVEDLTERTEDDMLAARILGNVGINEIREKILTPLGLDFKQE